MPTQRTKYQKLIFKEMSAFWAGKEIHKPWKHSLENGILKVRWLCNDKSYRTATNIGILLDWCQDHEFNIVWDSVRNVPGYKYFIQFARFSIPPIALTVEIPSG